jgi:hypothetical protein
MKRDNVSLHAECSKYSAERKIQIEQHRALLDVQFQIRGRALQFFPAPFHVFEVDLALLQRFRQRDAVFIFERTRYIQVEISRARGRTEKALPETRAFFIGPIDQPHRDRRPAAILSVNAPQDFKSRERVQTTIEPSAVRHGIDMATDEECFLRFTTQRRPKISRLVVVNLHIAQFLNLIAQPTSRFRPGRGKCDALGAIFVAGQLAQFLQFDDGFFRIQIH